MTASHTLPEGYEQIARDRDGTLVVTREGPAVFLQWVDAAGYQTDCVLIPCELVAWTRAALGRVGA